jgi:hypothetical protein
MRAKVEAIKESLELTREYAKEKLKLEVQIIRDYEKNKITS